MSLIPIIRSDFVVYIATVYIIFICFISVYNLHTIPQFSSLPDDVKITTGEEVKRIATKELEADPSYLPIATSSGQSLDDEKLPLQLKDYPPELTNIQWKLEEATVEYPSSEPNRLHGIYGTNFEWNSPMRKSLHSDSQDIRPRECRKLHYDLMSIPAVSVIFIHSNEEIELLIRSVHSVLDKTPPVLLREIIIVDDASTFPELQSDGLVDQYIRLLPKVRSIHLSERKGIVGARLAGIRAAIGDIFVILDSHIEATQSWLEPLASRIGEDPHVVVMPFISSINDDEHYSLNPHGIGCCLGLIWSLMEHAITPSSINPARMKVKPYEYQTSPTMAGGLYAANRNFFTDLGEYDPSMTYWGAENVEFSFRIWQCGGRLECTECSKIHHLFGGKKRYSVLPSTTARNRFRTAVVWMDEYGHLPYKVIDEPPISTLGDITERLALKQKLKCRNFKWFLDNVYPESNIRDVERDVPYLGPLRNKEHSKHCVTRSSDMMCPNSNLMFFRIPQHIHPTNNDEFCLIFTSRTDYKWDWCQDYGESRWSIIQSAIDPDFIALQNKKFKSCLTLVKTEKVPSIKLILEKCEDKPDQLWHWTTYKVPEFWKLLTQGKTESVNMSTNNDRLS